MTLLGFNREMYFITTLFLLRMCIHTHTMFIQELRSLFTDVQDGERGFSTLSVLSEGHYEFDERESAGVEDEVKTRELRSSFTYDYAQDKEHGFRALMLSVGHYEFDSAYEEMFWEPASVEDELKIQLQRITLSEENLV